MVLFPGNTITGNQWGGIDIRHGGDPMIHHNTVCNGVSDGVVIGEGGKGSIQQNIITGKITSTFNSFVGSIFPSLDKIVFSCYLCF